MPLSENEQKLLEQMERALYEEDPKFASQMRGARGSGPSHKRIIIGGVVALLGLGLVMGGVAASLIWLGVIGFVVMVAGMAWALIAPGARSGTAQGAASPSRGRGPKRGPKKSGPGAGSFSQRMEDRWDRRRRENGM